MRRRQAESHARCKRLTYECLENRCLLAISGVAGAAPVLPGDYNQNGFVNAADYVIWRHTLGEAGNLLVADGDGDQQNGLGDYDVWKEDVGLNVFDGSLNTTGITLDSGDYIPPIANSATHVFNTAWQPTSSDSRVLIPQGATVLLSGVAAADEVRVEGTLIFDANSNVDLTVTTLLIGETGKLVVRPNAGITHEVIFRDSPIDTSSDLEQITHGMIVRGTVDVLGQSKETYVELAGNVAAGSTTVNLAKAPDHWQVGDKIVLPDSANYGFLNHYNQREVATIAAINGSTLTLAQPVLYSHVGVTDYLGNLAALPPIADLTRNVIFRSENPDGVRGHIFFADTALVSFQNAELDDLGRTRAVDFLDSTVRQGDVVLHEGTNQIGRYTLHLHHTVSPAIIVGNVINGSSKWGIAIHDSHENIVADNVILDAVGAGIATEEGNETNNHIEGNYIIGSDGSGGTMTSRGGLTPKMIGDGSPGNPFRENSDLGHEGAGIWMHGQSNIVVDNVILNVRNAGITVWTRVIGDVNFPGIGLANPKDFAFPEFSGNQIWFSVGGLLFDGVAPLSPAIMSNTSIYGVDGHGISIDYSGDLVFDGLTVIGRNHDYVAGFEHQYLSSVIGRNWNIQKMDYGAIFKTNFDISDSFFANKTYNILSENSNSVSDDWIHSVIRNVTHAKAIYYIASIWDPTTAFVSQIEPRDLYVYQHNGLVGDDFQVLMLEQATDFVLPSSGMSDQANRDVHAIATANGSVTVSANTPLSPAALSNGDLFEQYGEALAGRVAPTDAETRSDILGLVVSIPDDVTKPTIDESSISVEYLSPTSVIIHWQTDEPSTSTVEYDHDKLTATHYGQFTQASHSLTTDHAVRIDGLTPNTLYAFRPYSSDSAGNSTTIRGILLGSATGLQRTVPTFHTGKENVIQHLMSIDSLSRSATIQWFTSVATQSYLEVFGTNYADRFYTPIENLPLILASHCLVRPRARNPILNARILTRCKWRGDD